MKITDTDRLNWIIENLADVDAPNDGDSDKWVVYTPLDPLGSGIGISTDLRKILDKAVMSKRLDKHSNNELVRLSEHLMI